LWHVSKKALLKQSVSGNLEKWCFVVGIFMTLQKIKKKLLFEIAPDKQQTKQTIFLAQNMSIKSLSHYT